MTTSYSIPTSLLLYQSASDWLQANDLLCWTKTSNVVKLDWITCKKICLVILTSKFPWFVLESARKYFSEGRKIKRKMLQGAYFGGLFHNLTIGKREVKKAVYSKKLRWLFIVRLYLYKSRTIKTLNFLNMPFSYAKRPQATSVERKWGQKSKIRTIKSFLDQNFREKKSFCIRKWHIQNI